MKIQKFNFTNEQEKAIKTINGIVCLSAGPGCGKTFVLVNRYLQILQNLLDSGIELEEAISSILAVTFTNKASFEMQERIAIELLNFGLTDTDVERIKYLTRISTIDSFASAFLKEVGLDVGLDPDFELVDNTFAKTKFIEQAQRIFDDYPVENMALPTRPIDLFEKIFDLISNLKSRLITPAQFLQITKKALENQETDIEIYNLAEFIKQIYEKFDTWMLKNNYMIFADLLFYTDKIFVNHPDILEKFARGIKYILIDEYQDLNDAQDKVLRHLSKIANQKENYFLVGDVGQSIYGFRHANYKNMLDYKLNKADVSLALSTNFRSTRNIVEFTNRFFADNNLYQKLVPNSEITGEKIQVLLSEDIEEETKKIAQKIKYLLTEKNYKLDDIKILLAKMTNVWKYVEELENLDIPFVIVGGSEFGNRSETLDILSIFRLISNVNDEEAKVRVLCSPIFGFEMYEIAVERYFNRKRCNSEQNEESKEERCFASLNMTESGSPLVELIKDFQGKIDELSLIELFDYILEKLDYLKYIRTLKKTDYHRHLDTIEKFSILLRSYQKSEILYSVEGFLEFFNIQKSEKFSLFNNEEIITNNAVVLMTIHKSKGLEFPVVFIAGGTGSNHKGLLHFHNKYGLVINKDDNEYFKNFLKEYLDTSFKEEKERVFYVAATRAKELLFIADFKSRGKYNLFVERIIENEEEFRDVVEVDEEECPQETQNNSYPQNECRDNACLVPTEIFYDDVCKDKKKQPKYFYSVSELELFKSNPEKYFLEKELNLNFIDSDENSEQIEFGNFVHSVMEQLFDKSADAECIQRIIAFGNYPQEKLHQKFFDWLKSKDWESEKSKNIAVEQNFTWKVGNKLIRGTIDRVDVDKIIDYKTTTNFNPEKYEFAMNIYRLAYNEIFGKKIEEMILVYPMFDKIAKIKKIDDEILKKEIIRIIEDIEKEQK